MNNLRKAIRINPVLCSLLLTFCASSFGYNNGLARTPPMGWSDFNQWGGALGDQNPGVYKMVADSIVSTGLREVGYIYVNKDGAYPYPGRSPAPQDSVQVKGFVPFSQDLSDYMHGRNLRWGVYMTTTDNPDSTARRLVDGRVDFLKHDDWGGQAA